MMRRPAGAPFQGLQAVPARRPRAQRRHGEARAGAHPWNLDRGGSASGGASAAYAVDMTRRFGR